MIEWLDDSLPDLAAVRARKEEFDSVTMNKTANRDAIAVKLQKIYVAHGKRAGTVRSRQ
jgi:hypothetical protein